MWAFLYNKRRDLFSRLYPDTSRPTDEDVRQLAQVAVDLASCSADDPSLKRVEQELRDEALRLAKEIGGETLEHVELQLELTR